MKIKTKKSINPFTVAIEACTCGSRSGVIEIEQEGTLQVPVVKCSKCGSEVDDMVKVS